jgi:hypothetical protein
MKTTTALLFLLWLSSAHLFAQIGVNNGVKFEHENFDFGTFDEGKLAEHTFVFTNKTGKIVTINNVQASCGCTTPSWTKEPIISNGQGKITAAYNSEGRPGAFSKTITVVLTEEGKENQTFVLAIKGNVLGKQKSNAENINGILTLEKDTHNFGKLQAGQRVAKTFTFKNTGTNDLSILSLYSQCNCVTHKLNPNKVILPNETAELELIYTPTQATSKDEMVVLFTNSTTQPQVIITLKGEVVQAINNQSILKETDGF